ISKSEDQAFAEDGSSFLNGVELDPAVFGIETACYLSPAGSKAAGHFRRGNLPRLHRLGKLPRDETFHGMAGRLLVNPFFLKVVVKEGSNMLSLHLSTSALRFRARAKSPSGVLLVFFTNP